LGRTSGAGKRQTGQNRAITALKRLLSFAQETGYLPFNVGAAVKLRPHRDLLAQRILEESEVAKLIDAAPEGGNQVLLKLLYVSGVRVSGICGLKNCDALARPQGGQITVFGKGGKTRTILLKPKVWQPLLSIRGEARAVDPVFRSRKGAGALDVSQVRRIVYAAARKAWPGAENLAALDAPCPRQPRPRPQRPDSPGAGHPGTRLGFHYRPASARPADRKLQFLSSGLESRPGRLRLRPEGAASARIFTPSYCTQGQTQPFRNGHFPVCPVSATTPAPNFRLADEPAWMLRHACA
jgi:hypothetical protein